MIEYRLSPTLIEKSTMQTATTNKNITSNKRGTRAQSLLPSFQITNLGKQITCLAIDQDAKTMSNTIEGTHLFELELQVRL